MTAKNVITTAMLLIFLSAVSIGTATAKINVVTTFSDFASITTEIGGDKVNVEFLSQGDQDPHFVAPKPSLALKMKKADMFVLTGMDLEIWASTLIDKARNKKIMDGGIGYVTVYTGLEILEKPKGAISRTGGDVHVSGNPHIHTSPTNWKRISENILIGLIKVDPKNEGFYRTRQSVFVDKVDRSMYGNDLVDLIGGDKLSEMLCAGTLYTFLDKEYQGKKLISRLGGWHKKALPFRDKKIMAYHKNWTYFCRDFGLNIIGFIEPKPGIPPTPKHVQTCVDLIKDNDIDLMLVANYFEKRKPSTIAQKTGIHALFLPLSVHAVPAITNNFELVDSWIDSINTALKSKAIISQ